MLPACRTAGEPFAIPQFALTRNDIDPFMDELREFHTAFRACFARQEPRDQFFNYMVGQFSALERKSIEPMALQVEGGKGRAMQRLVSETLWDEAAMLETYHRLVQDEMGEPDGVLIVDETGFVKKGADSVGVARQYCGSLGKVENCQVGVFAAYASRQGYALVDKRLFLPEPWFSERGHVADEAPTGCRDGPGAPPGGDTAIQVYGGGLPVRQQPGLLGGLRGVCGYRRVRGDASGHAGVAPATGHHDAHVYL
jgi:hypothetical protein